MAEFAYPGDRDISKITLHQIKANDARKHFAAALTAG
jgi:hypothetical protein